MDELELKQIIARELDSALGVEGGKLSADRRTALEYYEGEPFGNEVDGRSQVVMRTVLEAVEWVLPALLRIFTASDKIANFEATRPQDEAAGKQATEYISYIFYRDNPGFMLLHDWMKDALIQKLGWVKVYWNTQKVQEVNSYSGLTREQYDALTGGDVETIDEREYPAPMPDAFTEDAPDPQAAGQMLYDCTLRVTREEGRVRLENVPPEEVLVSRRAKAGDIPFVCHRREWRLTDLVEQGYDADTLDLVPSYDAPQYNTERMARYEHEDDFPYQTERTDKPMRDIWIEENYIRVDYDGDGLAELRKVVTAGNGAVILTKGGKPDVEEIDEVPLISICPVPMPHKLVGFSLADLVMDLQLIKSTLVRQMLDNIYLTNNPRIEVPDAAANEHTLDDILTSRPGGIIRTKQAGMLQPVITPFVAEKAMQLVEYFDQTGEVRTGVSRHNQGLNPDDLNKTATGVNMIQQAAAQRVELIARIFGETGIKEVCRRILGLVTRYQQQERIIRLTGQWVPMDPRQWRNQMEVSVSVGLGTGNRDQILQHLMQILQLQQGIVAQQKGLNGPLVYGKNVFDALEKLTENAGFKESFFSNPAAPPPGAPGPQQPPPDPEMMKAQHQMGLDAQKAQVDAQIQHARLQADLQVQQAKAAAEAQLAQQRAAQELALERTRADHAMQIEMQREAAKAELARYEIDARARAGAYTSGPAPQGGAAA